jgi:phospholipase A1
LPPADWQACVTLTGDDPARLACFDRWARQQPPDGTPASRPPQPATGSTALASAQPAEPEGGAMPPAATAPAPVVDIRLHAEDGCRDRRYSALSRFWELESGSTCDTFTIRGYRPISLSLVGADTVNTQPTSPNPLNNASTAQPYKTTETRIQLSVRTKVAQGLLTQGEPDKRDSLWFGYTQQSYWQLFTAAISRPFRSTDHEPEFIYVYPTDAALPGGWRLRYSGLGLVHQSNGQSLPLSRSWNRAYLMAGLEKGDAWRLQARAWTRLRESSANDDNPDISNHIGRAELAAWWNPDPGQSVGLTVRHSLRSSARGSMRLEWQRAIGPGATPHLSSGLRLHAQLFSGYGDSLLDYNRRRTVFSIGLSLVDF